MPRHVDPEERRAAIARAALDITATEGFGAVTIRRVATELGASTSTVTHFVTDRDDLLRLAVGSELAERRRSARAAVDDAEDGRDAIAELIRWAVLGTEPRGRALWLALLSAALLEPVLAELVEDFERWWTALTAELVERAVTADRLLVPAEDAVDALGVIVDGLVLSSFPVGQAWEEDQLERVLAILLSPICR